MRKGFELLRTIGLENNVDIDSLESQYAIKLPPLYRTFAESFELGPIRTSVFLHPEYERQYHCTSYIFSPDEEVGFSDFVDSVESAFIIWSNQDESLKPLKYFPVGGSDIHSGGILVATEGEMAEKIILDTDYKTRFVVIANNIFEFVRGIQEFQIEKEYVRGNIDHSKLYKNWGEDFWRLKLRTNP